MGSNIKNTMRIDILYIVGGKLLKVYSGINFVIEGQKGIIKGLKHIY
jgi:hypothetical protein